MRAGRIVAWTLADHRHPHHPLPVLLDAAYRAFHDQRVVQRSGQTATGGIHLGCLCTSPRAVHSGRGSSRGWLGCFGPFFLYLRNSAIFSIVATAGQVFCSALAAYAFARLRWPGRNIVFFAFLTALMVPPIYTALPNFILIKNLGLLNTFPGLVAPYFFMTPFAIFFLRQFFLGISREIEEAAKLDGAGHWRIFFQIILPMSSAPLVTLGILTFINMWNEYLWPLLVGTGENTRVLTVALGVFRTQSPQSGTDWAGLMAAVLIAALPLLILFFAFAKRIINSIGFSGMK